MTDPAGEASLRAALQAQGRMIHDHEKAMKALHDGLQQLHDQQRSFESTMQSQLQDLSAQSHPGPPPSTPPPAQSPTGPPALQPKAPPIEKYDGDAATCRSFLTLCSLTFDLQPQSFSTEQSRVAFMITNLTGRAREWATAEWENNSAVCHSAQSFSNALRRVFDHRAQGREAARGLLTLRQGGSRVTDHSILFRTLAAGSGWGEHALFDTFLRSLSDDIQDQLAPLDLPGDFESLVDLAIKIDNRLHDRRTERARTTRRPPLHLVQPDSPRHLQSPSPVGTVAGVPAPSEEPMHLGRTPLTPEERRRRRGEGRCFYCGQLGHFLAGCPLKGQAHQ